MPKHMRVLALETAHVAKRHRKPEAKCPHTGTEIDLITKAFLPFEHTFPSNFSENFGYILKKFSYTPHRP